MPRLDALLAAAAKGPSLAGRGLILAARRIAARDQKAIHALLDRDLILDVVVDAPTCANRNHHCVLPAPNRRQKTDKKDFGIEKLKAGNFFHK